MASSRLRTETLAKVPASAALGPSKDFRRFAMGLAPALAILVILLLLGLLLWLFDRQERDDQRQNLIRDALWVEQSLQFQFASQQDWFANMAKDVARGELRANRFDEVAGRYLTGHSEIIEVAWRDANGRVLRAVPALLPIDPLVARTFAAIEKLASSSGQTVYSEPVQSQSGQPVMVLIAPIPASPPTAGEPNSSGSAASGASGTLVVTYALDKALVQHAPWWIAEKRAVVLLDARGNELARRSTVVAPPQSATHTIEVGQPLRGMALTLTTFHDASSLVQNAVIAAMVGLGLTAIGGLTARERALRRREASEQALRRESAFRKAMEDSLTIGMRARDLDGRVTYVNQAFCRMTGWSAAELVGRGPPQPYWLAEDIERTRRVHDIVLRGDGPDDGFELTYQRRDGSRFDALIYEAPLIDASGRQQGWMGSFIDVTDRRRMEATARDQAERLQQTARLVTIGEMASLLAHDLNQPLAAISGYAAGLVNHLERGQFDNGTLSTGDIKGTLDKLGHEAERAGAIIRRVRDFAKRSEPHRLPVDLPALATATLGALSGELHLAGVDATIDADAGLAKPLADRVLLEQVLVNLIRNAIEALAAKPDGERAIDIALRNGQGWIEISVGDNGPGVAPDMRGSLFTAFASSKSSGMGMGLTICRSILELHGGGIGYENRTTGGSLFVCRLPVPA